MTESSVVFHRELVELFAAVSHDRNPLHTCAEYARATPFGEPVVFGVLAGLLLLSKFPKGVPARRIEMTFAEAIFIGAPYTMVVTPSGNTCRGALCRNGQSLLTVTASYDADQSSSRIHVASIQEPSIPCQAVRREPQSWTIEELKPGLTATGGYEASELAILLERLGLPDDAVSKIGAQALLWVSYLAGMELPGRQALLASIVVELSCREGAAPFQYRAQVDRVERRFRQVFLSGELRASSRTVANVQVCAFVRRPPTAVSLCDIKGALPGPPTMLGQTAVIIGASRGLGAAMALALAHRGCNVVGCYRDSHQRASALVRTACGAAGSLEMVQGDATSGELCSFLIKKSCDSHKRVDLLICAAAPPLRPLRLSASSAAEAAHYVTECVKMTAAPIGAFAPSLRQQGGQVLVISSRFVSEPDPKWPHYVAAKAALEHFVHALAPAHPRAHFIVARPPTMDTDFSQRLFETDDVLSPVAVAAELTQQLEMPHQPGYRVVEIPQRSQP